MVKERKNLGLGLLPIAALFLFNPNMAIVDVLPDFVGYLLLCIGLRALGDLNYHIDDAILCFRRMVAVSAVQFLSIFWLFGMCTPKERPISMLLLTFTFSTFEILLLTKGFREMFEGFLYLGSRMDATAVFTEDNKRRSATSRTLAATLFFVIAKAILTTLPEFASLTENSDSGSPLRFFYRYVSLFHTIAIAVFLPIAIVWLVKFIKYIRSILDDRPFIDALTDKYRTEILPKESLFIRRAVQLGTVILGIAVCLTPDIYIDHIDFLPDFLCPVILFVGVFMLRPYIGKSHLFVPFGIANAVTSCICFFATYQFNFRYSFAMLETFDDALNAYIILCILKTVDALFFLGMMISLRPALRHIIENYTGFIPEDLANQKKSDKLAYVHGLLNQKLNTLTVITIIAALSSILYIFLVPYFNFMWLVEFTVCLVFVVDFFAVTRAIVSEVEEKYMLS